MLGAFRFEQSDPARFYGALAADTAAMVAELWTGSTDSPAAGRTVCDVGGGPGYFSAAFDAAGMTYIGVEPDPREMHAGPAGRPGTGLFVRASGLALPFADDSVDVCLSSNVAEHVPHPWRLGNEMLRVTRPGGLVVLSYTVWVGPFGGPEMGRGRVGVGPFDGCADRRISPLPPTMGLVDGRHPGLAGIHREQSGAGVARVLRTSIATCSRFGRNWVM